MRLTYRDQQLFLLRWVPPFRRSRQPPEAFVVPRGFSCQRPFDDLVQHDETRERFPYYIATRPL